MKEATPEQNEANVRRLLEALKPFAAIAKNLGDNVEDDASLIVIGSRCMALEGTYPGKHPTFGAEDFTAATVKAACRLYEEITETELDEPPDRRKPA